MTNRRDFIRLSAVAAAGIGAPCLSAFAADPAKYGFQGLSGAAAAMFDTLPHVQLLGADSVGIAWMTAVKATGRVTWSQDNWRTERTAIYGRDGLLDANTFAHKAVLNGVDLRKPIQYRVHSRRIGKFNVYSIAHESAPSGGRGALTDDSYVTSSPA